MTAHCATCTCESAAIPPPATSSEWARRAARDATRAAISAAKTRRTETSDNRDKERT